MRFDRYLFSAYIQAQLTQKRIGLREAARESGVSASTLSRLVKHDAPDIESFAKLVHWLEVDANAFFCVDDVKPLTQDHRLAKLALALHLLDMPKDVIEAIVTIVKLVSKEQKR